MNGYIKEKILSPEELQEAIDLSNSLKWYDLWQYYNLFHMQRADYREGFDGAREKYSFVNTLFDYSRKSNMIGFYFLRYIPGSFTRLHEDNHTETTIVTLLDDKDLVGGHAVVKEHYEQRGARPADQTCHRTNRENEHPPYGQKIMLDVLPMEKGDSLVYGKELTHGVSKVYEGERLVLITWFNDKA